MKYRKYDIVLSREQTAKVTVYAHGRDEALKKAVRMSSEPAFTTWSDFDAVEPISANFSQFDTSQGEKK